MARTTTAAPWPPENLGEHIRLPGLPIQRIGDLDARACAEAEAHLKRDIAQRALTLRVTLTDSLPDALLQPDGYSTAQWKTAAEVNTLCAALRSVRLRRSIIGATADAERRHRQHLHDIALQRLRDEAPAVLEKINADLADLDGAAQRVQQFMLDVRAVTSAVDLIRFATRLREAAEAAGVEKLPPPPPSLPGDFDPLPAARICKLAGILQLKPTDGAHEMSNQGRAAIQNSAERD